jgi:hypothetical protein
MSAEFDGSAVEHSFIALVDFDGSRALAPRFAEQSATFSPNGRWAIIANGDSNHALVAAAGTSFIDVLARELPPASRETAPYSISYFEKTWTMPDEAIPAYEQVHLWISIQRFLNNRRDDVEAELMHIYGRARAQQLLTDEWPA